MKMRSYLIKAHQILSNQFGFDPLRLLRTLQELPHFYNDLRQFRKTYQGKISLLPCLHENHEEAGAIKSEYFWQDLLVARWIHEANPKKHVDIGSRVDGFVAHVASYREIEVFDIRSIGKVIPGMVFKPLP